MSDSSIRKRNPSFRNKLKFASRQVCVSITSADLAALNQLSIGLQRSRSDMCREAIHAWLLRRQETTTL